MNNKADFEMLQELRDWMDKYNVYFETVYYDYFRIVVMNSKSQSGVMGSNGYTLTKFDIDEYLLESKEEEK